MEVYNSTRQRLEEAANIVMSAEVTSHDRRIASDIFVEFRVSAMPYELCKYILEHSDNSFVLHQTLLCLQNCLIRDWSKLSKEFIYNWKRFFLDFVISSATIERYVVVQALQCIATVVKRDAGDTPDNKPVAMLVEDITSLLNSTMVRTQLIGYSLISQLLCEFSLTSKTSYIGMPWDFHISSKKSFQSGPLRSLFVVLVNLLSKFTISDNNLSADQLNVLLQLLNVTRDVLSWDFTACTTQKALWSEVTERLLTLSPGSPWRQILLAAETQSVFFTLSRLLRSREDFNVPAAHCILHLGTLSGSVFESHSDKIDYFTNFFRNFNELLTICPVSQFTNKNEVFITALTIQKTIFILPTSFLSELPDLVFGPIVRQITTLTCFLSDASGKDDSFDSIYQSSLDLLLETWFKLLVYLGDSSSPLVARLGPGCFRVEAIEIFNSFMKSRLGAPEGDKVYTAGGDSDSEEDDRTSFKDQLQNFAAVSRYCCQHSVPAICSVLENRLFTLEQDLKEAMRYHATDLESQPRLLNIFEDIHWLLLLSGYTLTDDDSMDGQVIIRSEILSFSTAQSGSPTASLELLFHPDSATVAVDWIVRILAVVLRLSSLESRLASIGFSSLVSPQVSVSSLWFLRCFVRTFVGFRERDYDEFSPAFAVCFAADSPGSSYLVGFLLDKSLAVLSQVDSESDQLEAAVSLLRAVLSSKDRMSLACKHANFSRVPTIGHSVAQRLGSDALRSLHSALASSSVCITDTTLQHHYWSALLSPVLERFHQLRSVQTHSESVSVVLSLDILCGLITGSRSTSAVFLFSSLQPILEYLVPMTIEYKSFPDVTLGVADVLIAVSNHILGYLGTEESNKVFSWSLAFLESYKLIDFDNVVFDYLDFQVSTMVSIMELLISILSKDFMDLSVQVIIGALDLAPKMSDSAAGEIAFYGLAIILPLLSQEMLQLPELSSTYFRLLSLLCENYPEQVGQLEAAMLAGVMTSLDSGIRRFGPTEGKPCYEAITSLAFHCLEERVSHGPLYTNLGSILESILSCLFTDKFDVDLLSFAAEALFNLIIIHKETYCRLVEAFLATQTSNNYFDHIKDAFNNLTPSIADSSSVARVNKRAFVGKLQSFVAGLRGVIYTR